MTPSTMTGKTNASRMVDLLDELQEFLNPIAAKKRPTPQIAENLNSYLTTLHARFRQHAGQDWAHDDEEKGLVSPDLSGPAERLRDEHALIITRLDLLIREVDLLDGWTDEERDVYYLKIQELIALLRRHEAEENLITYRSTWYDTGGEG